MLIGTAVFGRGKPKPVILAAMIGAVLPDLSLYLMAGTALFILGIAPQVVFDELYFSQAWQTVFAVDNSFVVWGLLLALALYHRVQWAVALTGAAMLHLSLDFPLHHDDGRPHFWPFSDWVFESPVSYWDRARGAMWVAPLELCASLGAAYAIWRQRLGLAMSCLVGVLLAAEVWVVRQWLFFFIDT